MLLLEQILSFKSRPSFKQLDRHPKKQTGSHTSLYKIIFSQKKQGTFIRLLASFRVGTFIRAKGIFKHGGEEGGWGGGEDLLEQGHLLA